MYGRKRQNNRFPPGAASESIVEKQCPGSRDSSLEL
jgi:hypothetical protein